MIAGASTDFGSDGHVTMTHQHTERKNERHVARLVAVFDSSSSSGLSGFRGLPRLFGSTNEKDKTDLRTR